MKKIIALCLLSFTTCVFTLNSTVAIADTTQNASQNQDMVLLNKLKKKMPLTANDMSRLKMIYQMKYVGEEELNPAQAKIYPYAVKLIPANVKKNIQKQADSQGGM